MRKDLKPIQFNNTIEGKIFVPHLESITNFESEIKVLAWPMDAEGVLTFNMSMCRNSNKFNFVDGTPFNFEKRSFK